MFIFKDQVTGADTKTRLRTKKVIDWDATLGRLFLIIITVGIGLAVFAS